MSVDNYTLICDIKKPRTSPSTNDFYLNMQQMQNITKERGIHFGKRDELAMPH